MTNNEQGAGHSVAWDGVRFGLGLSSLGFLAFDAVCAMNNQEVTIDTKGVVLAVARIACVAQSVAPTYRIARGFLQSRGYN